MLRLVAFTLLVSLSSCSGAGQKPSAARPVREDVPEFRHPTIGLQRRAKPAENPRIGRGTADAATLRDLKFLENARHAIGLYRQFIERAAGEEIYAEAVVEARERIAELEETIVFVERGMRERASR